MRPGRTGAGVAAAAAALALGAPLGWLGLRMIQSEAARADPAAELARNAGLYAYLLVGTLVAFVAFAAALGAALDRLRAANRQLRELSITDPLTGLRNARYFEERLREECVRGDRQGTPLGLVSIDLDRFKQVNDQYGHAFGDRALRHAGHTLSASARASDVVCRVGGEEFAVICPAADEDDALGAAERLRSSLSAAPFTEGSAVVNMTGSFGVAVRWPGDPVERVLLAADRALYLSKERGRNRVEAVRSAA